MQNKRTRTFPFWMCHGTLYLLKLCINFQLDHCTVYVELHEIVRLLGSRISIANRSRKKQHFCLQPIQKEHDHSWRRGGEAGARAQPQVKRCDISSVGEEEWARAPLGYEEEEKDDTHKCSQGKDTQRRRRADEMRKNLRVRRTTTNDEAQKSIRTRSEPLDSSF